MVIILLQRSRRNAVEPEHLHHEEGDALIDHGPEIAVGRIKRVVEIEHPGLDPAELCEDRRRFAADRGKWRERLVQEKKLTLEPWRDRPLGVRIKAGCPYARF